MSVDQQGRIWKYYQNQHPESFSWARPRLLFLARKVKGIARGNKLRILTVGAGDMSLERQLLGEGHSLTTVDLDEETIERLHELGVSAFQSTLAEFTPPDEEQDIAIASEVLEHIEPAELTESIQRVAQCLRTGGKFLVTVPWREDLKRSMSLCPNCSHEYHIWGHRQSFTEESLSHCMTEAGFHNVEVEQKHFVNYRMLNTGGRIVHFLQHILWTLFRRPNTSLKYFAIGTK